MSINKNFTYTLFNQIIINAFGFLSGIIITRMLGPEGRGIYTLFLTDSSLLVFFLGLSLSEGIIYFNGNKVLSKEKVFGVAIILAGGASLIALFVIYLFSIPSIQNIVLPPNYPLILFFLLRLYITFICGIINSIASGFLFSGKLFKYTNLTQIIHAIISFLSYGTLLILSLNSFIKNPIELVLTIHTILSVFYTILLIYFLQKNIKLNPDLSITLKNDLKPFLVYNLTTALAVMINFFNYRLDIYFLNHFSNISNIGIFSLAVNLSQLLWLFSNNLIIILMPYLSESSQKVRAKIINRYAKINATFLLLASGLGILIADFAIPTIYGDSFTESASLFKVLIIGSYFCGLTKIYGTYLGSINYFRFNLYSNLMGAITNGALCFLLIPRFGLKGAAVASLTAQIVMYLTTLFFVNVSGLNLGFGIKNLIISKNDLLVISTLIKKRMI